MLTWPEDERWELIDGVPYLYGWPYGIETEPDMDALNRRREEVSANLSRELSKASGGTLDLVVDVMFTCDYSSKTMAKYIEYHSTSVPEFWFVYADINEIHVYIRMADGKYRFHAYRGEDVITVGILPGFKINLKDIF